MPPRRSTRSACPTRPRSSRRTARPSGSTIMPASAAGRGLKVIVAGAGGAAHLPGMAASMTRLPVLGVPVESKTPGRASTACSRSSRCRPACRSARWRSARRARPMPACSPPRSSPRPTRRWPARLEAWRRAADRRRRRSARMIVPPGSTIGIVGGGQLGRMLALAAAQLGYRCHVYAPDAAPPGGEVAGRASPRRVRRRGGARRASPATSTSPPTSSRISRPRRSPRSRPRRRSIRRSRRWRSRRTG